MLACDSRGISWESEECQGLDSAYQETLTNICVCGHQTMTIDELKRSNIYCCSPNWPCQYQGKKIVCHNGTLLGVDGKCGNECPTALVVSAMSIATKKACDQKDKCYSTRSSGHIVNEVCDQGQDIENEFSDTYCGSNGKSVPCFNNGHKGTYNKSSQCFNTNYVG